MNNDDIYYKKDKIENVLINSNFNCGYFIDRTKLYNVLKYDYKIHSLYDPKSYQIFNVNFIIIKIMIKMMVTFVVVIKML